MKKFFEKKNEYSVAEANARNKQELVKSYKTNLDKIIKIKESIQVVQKDAGNTTRVVNSLKVFGACIEATQGELRQNMIQTINDAMQSIWEDIYPYKDYTNAKLVIINGGYDLVVLNRNNEWVRVEGILSGGERSAAAICIRIAFSLVLTKNLSMLILDEPTHNLDSNAIQKLSTMLRENLPSLVEQIFVITHDKELEKAASSSIYLLERNKDLDESTRVVILK